MSKANQNRRRQASARARVCAAAAAVAVVGSTIANTASAATYTYNPTGSATDTWSGGNNWTGGAPASANDTRLTFITPNTVVLPDGAVIVSTNDIDLAGLPFAANILDLQGTGPAAGSASVTIDHAAPAVGLSLAGTNPTVNLAAVGSTLTYNVNSPITLGANTTFTGAGTANFRFVGGVSAPTFTLLKQGASHLQLGGAVTLGGLDVGITNNAQSRVTFLGGADVTIGSGGATNLRVGVNAGSSNSTGILDASAANSFNVNVTNVQVGTSGNTSNNAQGTLNLPANSSITATGSFVVSNANGAFNSPLSTVTTAAAAGTNAIRTPVMTVGGFKSNGTFTVGAGNTLDIGGIGAGGRTALNVGFMNAVGGQGGSGNWQGTLNGAHGVIKANLSRLLIGNRQIAVNGTASQTGTMTFSADASNHLDVTGSSDYGAGWLAGTTGVVTIGYGLGGGGVSTASGTLTIGNLDDSSRIVSTNNGIGIMLGVQGASTTTTGTLNLNGGSLTITTTGLAITGGLAERAIVNFNGTTLKPGVPGTPGFPWISNVTANVLEGGARFDTNGHSIEIPQSLVHGGAAAIDGGLTKSGAGTLTLSGGNSYTGATVINGGRLDLTGSVSSGVVVNSGGAIGGEGAIAGALTFNTGSRLFFDGNTGGSLTAATADASGGAVEIFSTAPFAGTDVVVLSAAGGITGAIGTNYLYNSRGSIFFNVDNTQLLVNPDAAATLTWHGDEPKPAAWDVKATDNWLNGATEEMFYSGDTVLFDDTAASYNVTILPASVAPAAVTFNNSANAYFLNGGAINGAAALTKNGSNALIIAGAHTYSGGTTINDGSIILGGAGTLGSGPVTNNATLVADFDAGNGAIANAIGGGGNLVKNGTGTLTISGVNTYAGTTTINAGTLELAGSGTLGSGGSVVNNGAIVTTGTTTLNNPISGAGSFTQAGGGVVTLTGNNTYGGATIVNAGATLVIGDGGGSGTPGAGAIANAGTLIIDRGDAIGVPEVNGAGTLVKRGAGVLTLSGSNTAGSLSIGSNNAGGSVVVPAGASLAVGVAGAGALAIGTSNTPTGGTGVLDVSQASSFSANVATITIGSTGNNAVTSSGELHLPATSSLTAATSIVVGDSLGARNGDNGIPTSVVTTGGAGTTTVRTPLLLLGASKATVNFTLGAGNTLDVAGVNAGERTAMGVGVMSLGGGGGNYGSTVDLSAGLLNASLSSLLIGNNATALSSSNLAASLTIGAGDANHLDVAGPGNVVVVGRQEVANADGVATGTLTIGNLDATSSITSTDNGTGILVAGRAGGVGNSSGTVNLNGGTLTITTTGSAIAGGGGTSTVNFNGTTLRAGAASGTWIQNLTSANVATGGARFDTNGFDVTTPQAFVHDAALGDTADGGLIKSGAGTLVLDGANTYTGPTVASAGRLLLGKSLTTSSSVTAANDSAIELANDGSHNQFIKADTVTIDANASIDLKDNKLVTNMPLGSFNGTAYTGIQGEVQRAYNFGAWDQPGLTTSMPEAGQNAGPLSNTTTIATATASQVLFIEPTDTAVFQGQTVAGSSTIAMYTYAGDLNMDGLIDGADYGVIDNNVQFPGTDGYANGDFNYDGVIDGADYGIIDNAIQFQGAPFPGVVFGASGAASASLSGVTAVPEPTACGFAIMAGAMLLRRRRRAAVTRPEHT